MNYPLPNNQYYYGGYPYYPWNAGYPDMRAFVAPSTAGENYISSQWYAGFSPILVIILVTAGILAWWQYGAQVAGSKKAHSDILNMAVRTGGIMILLSITVNILGHSAAITHLEFTYQHMLMVLLACTLLWNYVASTVAGNAKGSDDSSGEPATKSSSSRSSSSTSGSKSSSSTSSSRPSSSSREASSRSGSSVKAAERISSDKPATSSSGVGASRSSTSRSSSSQGETSRASSSSRSGESKEKDHDPWEKSHPSAYISTTGKDRPRIWPFPIGFDKARPAGEKRLWWESGLPHVVGSIQDYSKGSSDNLTGGTAETKSESRQRPGVPSGDSTVVKPGSVPAPSKSESKSVEARQSVKDLEDRRQREKLKAVYLEMKKDPNTDPAKLAKLKKMLITQNDLGTTKSHVDEKPLARTMDEPMSGDGGSTQDKKDLLIAQYMHLKGNPNSDPADLKRLKSLIAGVDDAQPGSRQPSASGNEEESFPPSADPDPLKSKDEKDVTANVPLLSENSSKPSEGDKEQQRRQLKELYSKLKADPNADPRKLEKLKLAIMKLGDVGGTKSASDGKKDVAGLPASAGQSDPAKANIPDHAEIIESRIGENRRKNLRHLQMAICVATVAILNIQIGFLCGVAFVIYLVEDMINPIQSQGPTPNLNAAGGNDETPSHTSRSSDSKTSSSSSKSSSGSSSSKRTLTETEKASLPTSTGKSKDKDKTERLPPISMMYMATPSPKTPHVWAGPDFPLAVQGTSSALVSSVYTP